MDNLSRKDILMQAVHDCYKEMYAKAQPMADYDNILAEFKEGKINEDKDGKVYERHYLSSEEHKYIVDKYINAYRLTNEWLSDVGTVEEYIKDGGFKDGYTEDWTDKDGNVHPGYRIAEPVKSLKEQLEDYFDKTFGTHENNMAEDITNMVLKNISACKYFYRFDKEENDFRFTMALGHAPTSNKETVKNWWKEHYNQDIEIEDRNPELFWSMDEYGDEFEEIMQEEYGDNWKEYWDNIYQESLKKSAKENV